MLDNASSKNRRMQLLAARSTWRSVGLGGLAIVGLYFVWLLLLGGGRAGGAGGAGGADGALHDQYSVMIDAGSTGSRIHVYRFQHDGVGGAMVLHSELFEQLKPGLSHYKHDAAAAAASLGPLLQQALEHVPETHHAQTPVNVKATAGLRMLGAAEADAILEATRAVVRASPFFYDPEDAVEIMDGLDEGLFGWVTINYLTGRVSHAPRHTAAVLDLGGGSTQIALSLDARHHAAGAGTVTDVLGTPHRMFMHSFLGYGLMAARARVLAHGLAAADPRRKATSGSGATTPIPTPCVAPGLRLSYHYGDETLAVEGTPAEDGAGARAEACRAVAAAALRHPGSEFNDKGIPRPPPGQPVVALSYYMDRAVDAGLAPPGAQEASVTPAQYLAAAAAECAKPAASINAADTNAALLCLDLAFIGALLTDGFGLAPDTPIVLAKSMQFNGARVETQWSLGAALAEVKETRTALGLDL